MPLKEHYIMTSCQQCRETERWKVTSMSVSRKRHRCEGGSSISDALLHLSRTGCWERQISLVYHWIVKWPDNEPWNDVINPPSDARIESICGLDRVSRGGGRIEIVIA
ncbi:hypothetical protein SASPL_115667 [Salvia splendens]|uniref:Uncharacterized protein n=1 Tax=Salvia splendens TaxID=180675 RepID=A0A8X8Y814_SALSN|nr:hypothetical protein SASPL_115667 [Salvia splendens]